MNSVPVICIDGLSGSGKGSVAQLLAKKLQWHYLESGALYRILAYEIQKQQINLSQLEAIINLAKTLDLSFEISNKFQGVKITINGQDISKAIRSETIGNLASKIAVIPEVRQALLEKQQSFRKPPGLVTDGRDMGTVVFPDSPLKFFFKASVLVRAERRFKQLQGFYINVSLDDVINELKMRDHRDQVRALSPTIPAKDAIIVDTTHLTLDQVFERVFHLTCERLQIEV